MFNGKHWWHKVARTGSYNDLNDLPVFGFPSSDSPIDISTNDINNQYTAPYNGYACVTGLPATDGSLGLVRVYNATLGEAQSSSSTSIKYTIGAMMPVKKGDSIYVTNSGLKTGSFTARFRKTGI